MAWAAIGRALGQVAGPAVKGIAKLCGANKKTLEKLDVVVGTATGGLSGLVGSLPPSPPKAGKGGKANSSPFDTSSGNKL